MSEKIQSKYTDDDEEEEEKKSLSQYLRSGSCFSDFSTCFSEAFGGRKKGRKQSQVIDIKQINDKTKNSHQYIEDPSTEKKDLNLSDSFRNQFGSNQSPKRGA